jgi:hypothetical protein
MDLVLCPIQRLRGRGTARCFQHSRFSREPATVKGGSNRRKVLDMASRLSRAESRLVPMADNFTDAVESLLILTVNNFN